MIWKVCTSCGQICYHDDGFPTIVWEDKRNCICEECSIDYDMENGVVIVRKDLQGHFDTLINREIVQADAVYTGGSIWLFYGKLNDGSYFLTDDDGWTQILDSDPSDFDVTLYTDWQEEHCILTLHNAERIQFCNDLLDWLKENPDHCNGMTEEEICVYRTWFESDNY